MAAEPALRRFPSEHLSFLDAQTGARIHQITSDACINHPPYFLVSALTRDGKHLFFTSYRTGTPQLFEINYPDGEIRQLTEVEGLHPYSAVLSHDDAEIFYTRGGRLEAVHRHRLTTRLLFALEDAQFGECSLSADGRWIVTAFKRGGVHGVAVASTGTEGGTVTLEFPRTIIHPQFHPLDPDWIEFAADPAPRMFRVRRDGTGLDCLYEHGNDEFVVHETFLGETGDLVFTVWPFALKRMYWHTRRITTIAAFNAWHICPNRAGTVILCDTNHPDIGLQLVDVATGNRRTLCHPQSSNGGSQWKTSRYALAEDWAAARDQRSQALSWMEMPTDSVYGPQWTHPHPAFNHDETLATYTSDVSGHPQVYAVELPS